MLKSLLIAALLGGLIGFCAGALCGGIALKIAGA